MVKIAYHASHEQFKPSALLKYVQMAEQAGFTAGSSSDHFHPWSDRYSRLRLRTPLTGIKGNYAPLLSYHFLKLQALPFWLS